MKLHFRAPIGTRIEDTEKLLMRVEARSREIIPAGEIDTINDLQGVPTSYNLAFVSTDNVGDMDAEVLIALRPQHHATAGYMQRIRDELPREFPGSGFYFQSADIVRQVLNFGVPSPVATQEKGPILDQAFTSCPPISSASCSTLECRSRLTSKWKVPTLINPTTSRASCRKRSA